MARRRKLSALRLPSSVVVMAALLFAAAAVEQGSVVVVQAQALPPCGLLGIGDADGCSLFCRGYAAPQHLFGDNVCQCGKDDVYVSVCTTRTDLQEHEGVRDFFDGSIVDIPTCAAAGITDEAQCARVCSTTTWNTRSIYRIEQSVWSCICDARNSSIAVCGDGSLTTGSVLGGDDDDGAFFQVIPSTDVLRQQLIEGTTPQCRQATENIVNTELIQCFEEIFQESTVAITSASSLTADDLDQTCQNPCLATLLRSAAALNDTACLESTDPFTTSLRQLLHDLPSLTFLCQMDSGRYCHLLNPALQRLANTDGSTDDCNQILDHGACFGTILQGTEAGYFFGAAATPEEVSLVRTHIIDYCHALGVNVTAAASATVAPVNLLATSSVHPTPFTLHLEPCIPFCAYGCFMPLPLVGSCTCLQQLPSWLAELLDSPFRTAVRCELMSKITTTQLELKLDDPSVSVHKPQHPDMPLPETSTELRESVEELLQRVCLDRHKQVVLTPSQRTVLDDIVTHVFDVVSGNKGASNKGAGRLVVGPKGTGKTTLLLLLEKLLNMLLPASVVVFYASAQTHRDLYKLLHNAIKERTGLSMELPEDTSPSDAPGHFARWLKANKIKVVGLIDEYQAVYTFDEDRWWIIAMHVFGQCAARYTFVLTGSSAHLRGLCFDRAPETARFSCYKRGLPNLNWQRYTTLVLSPILTKHGLRDVVDHLGMLPMARFIRVDGDDNDDTSVQDEAWLRFIFMQTAGLMRNITSLIPAMHRMVEDSLTPVLQACCAIDDEALVATARESAWCGTLRKDDGLRWPMTRGRS
ncbi:hypothetical protein PTSG_02994 [Salpingoeca rosetta]|uniref:ORC1/DEAH AAA+ ATPase domain-containing protein n=1 Tax=Salpingoeca rosetta (strain ATCC 50818 / BSB-021) TaxID=946362 RepID=F2U3Y7_SALR5|nr:uncharacterized protein PTSG_02994 [Salpingoeca rosetta]EGD82331.1 hypothetical protein PTSG_02994 [Salpingoeca rosetta]|eukprot:XP_004996514.1 hypothetical protein PTSG_02994 [Salpingoeca rosetta]